MNPETTEQEIKQDLSKLDELNLACRQGDIPTIQAILNEHPEWLNIHTTSVISTQKIFPPLNHTVISGQLEAALWLIKRGADPNLTNYIGETSLHQAADNEQYSIAKLLLESGADPNIKQKDGETPMHNAIFRNDFAMLKLLLEYKANPNIANEYIGRTPLHYAVDNNNFEATKLLISCGADHELEDLEGVRPIDLASEDMKKMIYKQKGKARSLSMGTLKIIPESRDEDRLSIHHTGILNITPDITFDIHYESEWTDGSPRELIRARIFEEVSPNLTVEPDAELSIYKKDHTMLKEWLASIDLQDIFEEFIEGGLDDLESMINQMKSPLPINDSMLKSAGISKPGHRVRILMKLEEDAGISTNNFGNVTYSAYDMGWRCCGSDKKNLTTRLSFPESVITMENWLKSMRLELLYTKFRNSGYDNLDMIKKQVLSRFPFNDETLKHAVGIDKAGHRFRILSKLEEEMRHATWDSTIKLEGNEPTKACASCLVI
jgi:hypothetical protein